MRLGHSSVEPALIRLLVVGAKSTNFAFSKRSLTWKIFFLFNYISSISYVHYLYQAGHFTLCGYIQHVISITLCLIIKTFTTWWHLNEYIFIEKHVSKKVWQRCNCKHYRPYFIGICLRLSLFTMHIYRYIIRLPSMVSSYHACYNVSVNIVKCFAIVS